MAVITRKLTPSQSGYLRPFDPRRDLEAVADLIEFSFSATLDPDGRRYLRQMRSAARKKGGVSLLDPKKSLPPMVGYVWEENGRVVANLSLVPFFHQGRRIDLIANVAVYPEYRRRGIARTLTSEALEKSKRRLASATWLQVRHDNQAAIDLYSGLGFESRALRTTWVASPDSLQGQPSPGFWVTRRNRRDWFRQRLWLDQNYPPALRWYFPLKMIAMSPGPLSYAYRLLNDLTLHHWTVYNDSKLQGVLSWQGSYGYADHLWLAASAQYEDQVLKTVLPAIRREHSLRRPVRLDLQAGRATGALEKAGFKASTTLIWMEFMHSRNNQG